MARQRAIWRGGLKFCACGRVISNNRYWHCDRCRVSRRRHKQREKEQRRPFRGTPTERGYGTEHTRLRRRLAPLVATGKVRCARCGELIAVGAEWDLGHDDYDRSRYTGPEHIKCNRATANRR